MFDYVTDKEYISRVRSVCGPMVQEICHELRQEFEISATPHLIGSGARNLIMQNNNNGIDLDYNIEICYCNDIEDCKQIKADVMNASNTILNNHGWGNCKDSRSCVETEERVFNVGNRTPFSIDIGIVTRDKEGNWYRLIHKKTGIVQYDEWYWNIVPNSKGLKNKVYFIKSNGYWSELRDEYKRIKNLYLSRSYYDDSHHSFVCYIEAINNIYNRILR